MQPNSIANNNELNNNVVSNTVDNNQIANQYQPQLNAQPQYVINNGPMQATVDNNIQNRSHLVKKIRVQNVNSTISLDTSSEGLDFIKHNSATRKDINLDPGFDEYFLGGDFINPVDLGPQFELNNNLTKSDNGILEIPPVLYIEEELPDEDENTINRLNIIGRNERNIVKKGIEFKKRQIIELLSNLFESDSIPSNYKTIVKGFLNVYMDRKYIRQHDLISAKTPQIAGQIIDAYINKHADDLLIGFVYKNTREKIEKVRKYFLLINRIDSKNSDIDSIIKTTSDIDFNPEMIKNLKATLRKYIRVYKAYFNKISTKKFSLTSKEVLNRHLTLYNTGLVSSVKFSKIYSDYIIEKSYQDDMIIEDLRLVQLKLLSECILKDLYNFSFEKKYIIYLPDSIYNKPKKIKAFLMCMDDAYSQSKIFILLTPESLINNIKVLSKMKKSGYIFALETSVDFINENDMKQYLYICDIILVVNNIENPKQINKDNIPMNMLNNVININQSLISEVVVE